MPQPQLLRTIQADRDLDELFDWITRDSGLDRAEAVLRRIEETLSHPAAMPGIGRVRHDLEGDPRSFSVWPWVIIYEPVPQQDGIVVWRIVDGRRDLPRTVRRTP